MLYDAKGFSKIYIRPGYTDLRKSIDGLKFIIGTQMNTNPFQENVIFLFCGRSTSKIKALVWEPDGFLLLVKRLESGGFNWPRTTEEAKEITQDQFDRLMQGFTIESTISKVTPRQAF